MALRSVAVVTPTGLPSNAQVPTSSDTIHINDIGPKGCILDVVNVTGGPITVTILDGSRTPAGTPAAAAAPNTVPNSLRYRFLITPNLADSSGLVTILFSATTNVTYDYYRVP